MVLPKHEWRDFVYAPPHSRRQLRRPHFKLKGRNLEHGFTGYTGCRAANPSVKPATAANPPPPNTSRKNLAPMYKIFCLTTPSSGYILDDRRMAMGNDAQLLQDYLAGGSEPAFAQLVRQYIDLVYSAARRQVRDEHLAQDITQAVFILLSAKAAAIRNPAALPAWLLKTTHLVACNALRDKRRRANHEKE